MHTYDLVVNDCRAGEAIEGIAKLLPHFDGKAPTALVVKAINAVDAGAFMVAPQQEKVFGILDLVGKEQTDHFERLFSAIHIVSQEQIVGLNQWSKNNKGQSKGWLVSW